MRRRRVSIGYAAVTGLTLLVVGCKKANQYAPPPAAKVSVAKPLEHKITRYLEATGNTSRGGRGRSHRPGAGFRASDQLCRRRDGEDR